MAKGGGYDRGDASVACPYYISSTQKEITCAGGLDPNGKVENKFRTEKKKREYKDRYCRSCYHACSLCKVNDRAQDFERPPSA